MKTVVRIKFLVLVILLQPLLASGSSLSNGPMIGYATMAEVLIWVQTASPASVEVEYWSLQDPDKRMRTDPVTTRKATAYVAKCLADQVKAGTGYGYAVYIDGQRVEPQFRADYREGPIPLTFETPPNWRFRASGHEVPDFTVGFGSCAYINEREGGYDRMNGSPYGSDYHIFEAVHEVDPDVFIWLGDNVYYREPDWTSRTGMIHRWTHDRAIDELRPMMATIPQYAIWDDHDYGPNDIGREFWNKAAATDVFNLFNGNPTAGLPELPGIFTYFAWGDVHFYLTDNRTYRTVRGVNAEPFGYKRQMLGKEQVDWLIELMKYNRLQSISSYPCSFHVVAMGTQVLSPWSRDGYPKFPDEWNYLFDRLVAEEIHNVIFISGDVHFSEVSQMIRTGDSGPDFVFWDITSSSMTAGSSTGPEVDENPYRLDVFPGDIDRYGAHNFATLSFEGSLPERRAVLRYYDAEGNLLNQDPEKHPGQPTRASIIPARHLILSESLFK
jgi:alkaline phosphatase D